MMATPFDIDSNPNSGAYSFKMFLEDQKGNFDLDHSASKTFDTFEADIISMKENAINLCMDGFFPQLEQ